MMKLRDRVLLEIERIFQEWIKYVAINIVGLPEDEVAECGGQLFVAGSHRLGIREIGSDIDTVGVAPNFCDRVHFFSSLKERLISHPDVSFSSAFRGFNIHLL